jgi:glyoxylase-like metal-dependent hydrolase (beta-lactamase superfamily II)
MHADVSNNLPTTRLLLAFLVVAWTAGCGGLPPARSPAMPEPLQVADGVYMFLGAKGEVDPANLGRIGNAGFIVGESGVVAIDTGTSRQHGEDLLAAIARVTDKPVRLALITHTRQEFLFGAGAFRARGIPVAMHRRAANLMAARCENCLKTLRRQLGEAAMSGTAMFKPDIEFEASHTIDPIGRPIEVLYFGHSSGPGDVAVLDTRSGVFFAGGLVDNQRIPDVQDSDRPAWLAALGALPRLPLTAIVPGHGPAGPPGLVDSVRRYLTDLERHMAELLQAGVPLSGVAEAAALPAFSHWDRYDSIHLRNASIVYLQLERESMFK